MRKKNIITSYSDRCTEKAMEQSETETYPFLIQRRLRGLNTAIAVSLFFGAVAWIFTGSLYGLGLGLFTALLTFVLKSLQKSKLSKYGYENWRFETIEQTRLTPLNIKPTGFYATALDGPYAGKMCHISLSGAMVAPSEGQIVELCVPGGIEASMVRDIYYIPEYYGINFLSNHE